MEIGWDWHALKLKKKKTGVPRGGYAIFLCVIIIIS